ncbi:hypothetical protein YC2023_090899 [Brassica napus]
MTQNVSCRIYEHQLDHPRHSKKSTNSEASFCHVTTVLSIKDKNRVFGIIWLEVLSPTMAHFLFHIVVFDLISSPPSSVPLPLLLLNVYDQHIKSHQTQSLTAGIPTNSTLCISLIYFFPSPLHHSHINQSIRATEGNIDRESIGKAPWLSSSVTSLLLVKYTTLDSTSTSQSLTIVANTPVLTKYQNTQATLLSVHVLI